MQLFLKRWTLIVGVALVATACCNNEVPSIPPSKSTGTATSAPGKCDAPRDYEAPAQRFDERAQDLAHATGCFIETDTSETGAVQVPAVKGTFTIREAIAKSTEGTRLKVARNEPDLIAVEVNKEAEKAKR